MTLDVRDVRYTGLQFLRSAIIQLPPPILNRHQFRIARFLRFDKFTENIYRAAGHLVYTAKFSRQKITRQWKTILSGFAVILSFFGPFPVSRIESRAWSFACLACFALVYAETDSILDLKGQSWTDSKNLRWVTLSSKVILILTGTKYQNTEHELFLLGRDEELTLKYWWI